MQISERSKMMWGGLKNGPLMRRRRVLCQPRATPQEKVEKGGRAESPFHPHAGSTVGESLCRKKLTMMTGGLKAKTNTSLALHCIGVYGSNHDPIGITTTASSVGQNLPLWMRLTFCTKATQLMMSTAGFVQNAHKTLKLGSNSHLWAARIQNKQDLGGLTKSLLDREDDAILGRISGVECLLGNWAYAR